MEVINERWIAGALDALMITLDFTKFTLDKDKIYQGGYVSVTLIRFSI